MGRVLGKCGRRSGSPSSTACAGCAPPRAGPVRGRPWPSGRALANRRVDEAAARRRLMLLVDTNVLVDVLQNDPQWADRSIAQMRAQARLHAMVINPVIYA